MDGSGKPGIIFLDFDGVMMADYTATGEEARKIVRSVAEERGDAYLALDKIDVSAAVRDWKADAVEAVRMIAMTANAELAVHSSWRSYNSGEDLRMLLSLRGLDDLYAGKAPYPPADKGEAIRLWLAAHDGEYGRCAVIDDQPVDGFRAVQVKPRGRWLSACDVPRALEMLRA